MLSIKNLVKVYKAKGGVGVRALDSVSIDFPEKGMVFLLGRSGSGKSTLLNVIGGLDAPTEGEIIVKGRSSKDFTASDFDSYRNTYIGFVFQDYNLLHEFSVEENIAIALQLQSKPNDKQAVDNILEQVELGGLGKRKPNTLSGGQMQRVAIARALIKDPEIIMADEPTGALDSNTGKQILDTLKNLSKSRLVIVVSHDRAFAEEYGDRIIELKDGVVIADKTKTETTITENDKNVNIINDEIITVKDWKKVTEDDIKQIVEVMKERGGETVITSGKKEMPEVKKALGITENAKKVGFKKTEHVERRDYDGSEAKFIKSKLPMSHAFKMAGSSLKFKPFKLLFTIFLSVIAFTLFGVLSTLMLYDPAYSVSMAMVGSQYESVALEKQYEAQYTNVMIKSNGTKNEKTSYQTNLRAGFTREELNELNDNDLSLKFAGVYDLGYYKYTGLTNGNYTILNEHRLRNLQVKSNYVNYYANRTFCGFTDCGEAFMTENGFECLAGRYPETPREIAIPYYIYDIYCHSDPYTVQDDFNFEQPSDMLGTTIYVGDLVFEVVGIYDVGEIPAKFDDLKNPYIELDYYETNSLKNEMADLIEYSFHTVGFVSKDFYETYKFKNVKLHYDIMYGTELMKESTSGELSIGKETNVYTPRALEKYQHAFKLLDRKGSEVEFNVTGKNIYLSIYYVVNQNFTDYRFCLQSLSASEKQENAELFDAMNRFVANTITQEDYILLYRTMIDGGKLSYKNVVGSDMKFDAYWQLRNSANQNTSLKVAGVFVTPKTGYYSAPHVLLSDEVRDAYGMPPTSVSTSNIKELDSYSSEYVADGQNDVYGYVLALSDNAKEQSMFMLEKHDKGVHYAMKNDVYELAVEVSSIFDDLKSWFLIAGLVVGAFAALMLFNFISVGIENKKNEIGILRAVGARGIDVFKIFIIEALLITTICFILSSVASAFVCALINKVAIESIISISFLNYRFINVLFILGVSLIIALLGTIFPVTKAARKSPVESIRAI